jgi:hypothetical protein
MSRAPEGWRVIERPAELFEIYARDPATLVSINGREPRELREDWDLVLAGGTPLIVGLCALGAWDVSVHDNATEEAS